MVETLQHITPQIFGLRVETMVDVLESGRSIGHTRNQRNRYFKIIIIQGVVYKVVNLLFYF